MTPPPRRLANELSATAHQFAELTPAMSLAYVEDEEIITAGWGADPDTLFQAASISKPVAAALTLRLVADGKLALDDDIAISLRTWSLPPSEANDGSPRPRITVRHLLCHGAGLGVHGFPGYGRDDPIPTLVEILDGQPPANTAPVRSETPPGLAALYSGGGYTVLHQLIEDTQETPFADLAAERILGPLGMEAATFALPIGPELERRAAPGFVGGLPVEGGWRVFPELAAAGLWCTPTDLVRFARGVQCAFDGERDAFLPKWLAEEMIRPHFRGWGLGPSVYGTSSRPHFGHTGGNAGYRCALFASAHRGPAAAVMTNSDEGGDAVPALLNRLAPHLGWSAADRQPLEPPDP